MVRAICNKAFRKSLDSYLKKSHPALERKRNIDACVKISGTAVNEVGCEQRDAERIRLRPRRGDVMSP
jgi:hypothetical protein